MFFKSIALAASALVISTSVNAALITNLYNLNINGTNYDVTFHTGAGESFNALWDADDDGVFGGGASVYTSGPTFWGDSNSAYLAAEAIMRELCELCTTTANGSDSFLVPYSTAFINADITNERDQIYAVFDYHQITVSDVLYQDTVSWDDQQLNDAPYVTFTVTTVPVPAAVWLFGSGLLGLIGVARRKYRT